VTLKTIQTSEEHALALEEVSKLMDSNVKLGSVDGNRLDALVSQVQTYESIHFPMNSPNRFEAIAFRVEQQLDEIHPDEILLEEFMKPMNMSTSELADALDLPLSEKNAIINGKLPIAMDVALRLGKFYAMDPEFWLNLQTEYDSRKAKRGLI
jgi:addiction module HigA family antidote